MFRHYQPATGTYQLDLVTPGMSPWCASSLKQILQMPNFRMKPRGRPQSLHRLYLRTLNFGVRLHFSMSACFAK